MKSVLLLEDVDANAQLVQCALEQTGGLDVVRAASGDEAVALFGSRAFDICLFDQVMAGMSGLEAMRQIRASACGRQTPIAFLTAQTDPATVDMLIEAGAVTVIAKPLEILRLVPTLQSAFQAFHSEAGRSDARSVPVSGEAPRRLVRHSYASYRRQALHAGPRMAAAH